MKPISASEIQTDRECKRKWGYEYYGRIRPDKVGAGLGTLVHSVLEKYLETGEPVDVQTTVQVLNKDGTYRTVSPGLIATAGLHLIPKPPVPLHALETKLEFEDDGISFHGRADLVLRGPGPWLVYDHKTTSDFRYVKSEDDLKKDAQALLYSRWAYLQSGLDDLDLVWIYYRTKKQPKAERVRLRVLQSETAEEWDKVKQDARHIRSRANLLLEDVPQNFFACSMFGGCPHKPYCHGEMFMSPKQSFDQHLANLNRGLNPPPVMGAAPPPPPPPPLLPEPTVKHPSNIPNLNEMNREELKAMAIQLGLTTDKSKERGETFKQKIIQHLQQKAVESVISQIVPALGGPPNIPPPPALPKEERDTTRPSGRPAVRASVMPSQAPIPVEPSVAPPNGKKGYTLYIDCMPMSGTGEKIVLFAQWATPVLEKAAQMVGQPDYRLADYGKGPGAFRTALNAYLDYVNGEMHGVALVVHSSGNSDAIPTLEGAARAVIRGMR